MSAPKDLRGVVAGLCQCAPEDIRADSSLDVPALRGSLKKAVLIASIRRYLGKDCMAAAKARTFGELEAMVSGQEPPPPARGERPAPSGTASPGSPPPTAAVQVLSGGICGIDIEPVAKLPDAIDYARSQFYKDSFSPAEIAYCAAQSAPKEHFAVRWCAKEALIKCDPAFRDIAPRDLELAQSGSGRPFLRLRGLALPHAVSVSHTDGLAAAVVMLAPPSRQRPLNPPALAALALSLIALSLAAMSWLATR